MNKMTTATICILAAAVITLSFLYYQETRDDVKIKLDIPNVSVERS